ncbi:helix-turn-helix transcriptional regulator [Dyadobacter aurulentus]|uniref:helix-turn-helix transcriptional regulator n=1 Tax=Dyadobacter sp. UC 10 TaxID=2605428 RepID=UPI0011F24D4D|nr:helix-turn-helix transcriptional regulator [Dyadobacter sp. UC 10]KAA0993241.1 helix-turn-helix transcriptional regulator [Dyadobacter sp. UC 10]
MNLSDKIKQILITKAISPSLFADEIGIQRSSMSHILAGRNKPSLEMVQKIVKRYPDLGLDWIMEENELPEMSLEKPLTFSRSTAKVNVNRKNAQLEPLPAELSRERKIAKIVVFYTDGTFKEFSEA